MPKIFIHFFEKVKIRLNMESFCEFRISENKIYSSKMIHRFSIYIGIYVFTMCLHCNDILKVVLSKILKSNLIKLMIQFLI